MHSFNIQIDGISIINEVNWLQIKLLFVYNALKQLTVTQSFSTLVN